MTLSTASNPVTRQPSVDEDHTHGVVPLSKRRSPITMGLLWITMVTAFPTVLEGVQFYKDGLTLGQVLLFSAFSCVILLVYAVLANFMGAKTGQTYGLLSRRVFGRWGSRLVSVNLNLIFVCWYGLTALMLADALKELFKIGLPVTVLATFIGFVMAFNNFFGFSGVANFARFLAAPALIAWVAYTFFKVVPTCPMGALVAVPDCSSAFAMSSVSALVIGYAVWGNEPDYWRYGKPSIPACAIPTLLALMIGQVIFPVTGWMVARMSGVTDYAAATNLLTNYSFGGMSVVAALVLAISYFAVNDSNLYGAINALENLVNIPHKKAVIILAVLGAATAGLLSVSGAAKALESVAALNCILLPTSTVIMICEWVFVTRVLGRHEEFSCVPIFAELPSINLPAVVALILGITVGVFTSGIIPGLEFMHIGICSVQAWAVASLVYLSLRAWTQRRFIFSAPDACKLNMTTDTDCEVNCVH